MKRFVTIFALAMLAVAPAAMAQGFGWSISNSTVDPDSNTGAIGSDPANPFGGLLYLWLNCDAGTAGMSAAEFDLVETTGAPGSLTAFTPQNGFLNAGGAANLLLAVGGCPSGPVLAGNIAVGPDAFVAAIDVCLAPAAANGNNLTVECGTGAGLANSYRGFNKGGAGPCETDSGSLCPTISVESENWGSIKALYR